MIPGVEAVSVPVFETIPVTFQVPEEIVRDPALASVPAVFSVAPDKVITPLFEFVNVLF